MATTTMTTHDQDIRLMKDVLRKVCELEDTPLPPVPRAWRV